MNSSEQNIALENSRITDIYTQENINHYYKNKSHIDKRLLQLEKETSIEQIFEMQDAANVSVGILMSLITGRKKWLLLPLLTVICQSVHSLKRARLGTSLLAHYGFRTREDIDKERYALKALRGDFQTAIDVPNVVWNAVNK